MKKLLYTIGTIGSIALPVAAVVSCGTRQTINPTNHTIQDTAVLTKAKTTMDPIITALGGSGSTVKSVVKTSDKIITTMEANVPARKRVAGATKKATIVITISVVTNEIISVTKDGVEKKETIKTVIATANATIATFVHETNKAVEKETGTPSTPGTGTTDGTTGGSTGGSTGGTGGSTGGSTGGTGGSTGGGTQTPAAEWTYNSNTFTSEAAAKAALDADATALKVWGISGDATEYATEDAAKDAYVTANASSSIATRSTNVDPASLTTAGAAESGYPVASGVTTYYIFNSKAYSTKALAQAAWLASLSGNDLTKTAGVDTITYTTTTAGVTLSTTTEEVTRHTSTATAAPTITIGTGVKTGTDGVTAKAGTPKAAAFPSAPAGADTFVVDTTTYTYKTTVAAVAGTAGNDAGFYTVDEITGFSTYKATAYSPTFNKASAVFADGDTYTPTGGSAITYKSDIDGDNNASTPAGWFTNAADNKTGTTLPANFLGGDVLVNKSVSYTYKAAVAHVDHVDGVTAGWYDGANLIASIPTIYETPTGTYTADQTKALMENVVTGVQNSEIKTYSIMKGATKIGEVVVKSPEFGQEKPTSSFTDPTASIVTVTVTEKTPYVAKVAADAPDNLITTGTTSGTITTEGVAVSTLPAATAYTVHVYGGNAYKTIDDAKAALKAAITSSQVSQKDSASQVVVAGQTYTNIAAAYAALIVKTA